MLLRVIKAYQGSKEFSAAREASRYADGDSPEIAKKVILQPGKIDVECEDGTKKKRVVNKEIVGNRISSNFLQRFVTQENQYLLGNGLTLESEEAKARLGLGFDTILQQIGERALVQGVCWGFWNYDHMERIDAAVDANSGFVALLDEMTSAPMVGVHFWQIAAKKPMYVRLFEVDGMTIYRKEDDRLVEYAAKTPYRMTTAIDAIGEMVIGAENYGVLPVIPLYGDRNGKSVLTPSIKTKIDAYDVIISDFSDNLEKANDVYWVLNNFGGTTSDVAEMLDTIHRLRAVVNISDGTGGGSTAQQMAFEVPYEARRQALELLRRALYEDANALDMSELSGGSLTNVAIRAASTNLEMKCDKYEWQVFSFVQQLLRLLGIKSEKISFTRRSIMNMSETVQDIATMRQDIDQQTALELNPYIMPEKIEEIMEKTTQEALTGASNAWKEQHSIL